MTTTEKAVPESEQTTRALDAAGAVGASGTHGASGAAGPSGTRAASGAAPASGTHTPSGAAPASAAQRWVGRVLSGLAVVFLLFDGLMKVLRAQPAVEGTVQLGYPESTVVGIGLILLACLALHLIPRTAVLGAILLTGYLGGAVATHVRLLNRLFSHTLFPVYVGVLIWLGLALRDAEVRRVLLAGREN